MTATVEETKQDLTRLIRLARGGEEIVITQGGQAVAKLTAVHQPEANGDRRDWLRSLRTLRDATSATSAGRAGRSSDEILREDRSGRD